MATSALRQDAQINFSKEVIYNVTSKSRLPIRQNDARSALGFHTGNESAGYSCVCSEDPTKHQATVSRMDGEFIQRYVRHSRFECIIRHKPATGATLLLKSFVGSQISVAT